MKTALHIMTQPDDRVAREMIALQGRLADLEVRVVDLSGSDADYRKLLEEIFAADAVEVW